MRSLYFTSSNFYLNNTVSNKLKFNYFDDGIVNCFLKYGSTDDIEEVLFFPTIIQLRLELYEADERYHPLSHFLWHPEPDISLYVQLLQSSSYPTLRIDNLRRMMIVNEFYRRRRDLVPYLLRFYTNIIMYTQWHKKAKGLYCTPGGTIPYDVRPVAQK